MWVFLKTGFISVVQSHDNKDMLSVRARSKDALTSLNIPEKEILETFDTDYRFRAFIHKVTFSVILAKEIKAIDYTNFKDSISDHKYHRALLDIWITVYNTYHGRANE